MTAYTFTSAEINSITSDLSTISLRSSPVDCDSVDDLRRDMAHIRALVKQITAKIFASGA